MEHNLKSITAELARINDSLAHIEAELSSILGEDDTFAEDTPPAVAAAPKGVNLVLAERVSRYLEQLAGTPIAQSRLVNYIGGHKDATRRAVRWLADEGHATVTVGPRNSKMYTTRRPFRVAPEPATPRQVARGIDPPTCARMEAVSRYLEQGGAVAMPEHALTARAGGGEAGVKAVEHLKRLGCVESKGGKYALVKPFRSPHLDPFNTANAYLHTFASRLT